MNENLMELAIRYGRSLLQQVTGVDCGETEFPIAWANWTTPYLFAETTTPTRPLRSLWTMVQARKSQRQATLALAPLRPIDLERAEGRWLQNPVELGKDLGGSPVALGEAFTQQGGRQENKFERFYGLMQKYASALPCTYGEAGVSLFQQWRMAAAVMATATGDTPDTLPQELALIGLDLPGIQETVYTIASRGAGKSVRGRSAFVQLLVNAVVDRIVHDLKLCRANILVNAGGNAIILASATEQLETYLHALNREVNELLLHGNDARAFAGFQGDLALALAWIKLPWSALTYPCEKEYEGERSVSRWQYHEKQLKEKLQAAKLRPFSALMEDEAGFKSVFEIEPIDSNRYCAVCRRPENQQSGEFGSWHEEDAEIAGAAEIACPVCKSFVKLASSLGKRGVYLKRTLQPPDKEAEVWQIGLAAISGYWYALTDQLSLHTDSLYLALSPDNLPVPGVSGFWPMATTTPLVTGKDREEVVQPDGKRIKGGDIRDNALLAAESPGTFKRLGVLKADVDNLGEILINGLDDRRSAALTATLSESLTLFFGGWLDKICMEELFYNNVYILYAGGDDLLIIGAWHVMPLLAARIAQDFGLYTGQNPGVHLSAGISIIGAKEPLYAAVDAANKALKQAKHYPTPRNATKNAINFFGKVVEWRDFQDVQTWQNEFAVLMQDGAPKSLLMTLLQIYQQYQDDHKSYEKSSSGYATRARLGNYDNRTLYLGPWLWQMIYRLYRLSNNALTKEKIQEIQTALLQVQSENRTSGVEKIALSARWTQLLSRENK